MAGSLLGLPTVTIQQDMCGHLSTSLSRLMCETFVGLFSDVCTFLAVFLPQALAGLLDCFLRLETYVNRLQHSMVWETTGNALRKSIPKESLKSKTGCQAIFSQQNPTFAKTIVYALCMCVFCNCLVSSFHYETVPRCFEVSDKCWLGWKISKCLCTLEFWCSGSYFLHGIIERQR